MFIKVIKSSNLLLILLFILSLLIFLVSLASRNASIKASQDHPDLPIYCVEDDRKRVSLTFDCAWDEKDIPQILNTLRQESVKATFFLVGSWALRYPDTVKMITEEGHDIANHSQNHFKMSLLSKEKIRSEIIECSKNLEKISGVKVNLFRAPYGDYTNKVVAIARQAGCHTIQWDVDSLDWKPGISKETILNRVVTKVNSGSIILMHNGTSHTAEILPEIIKSLKKESYKLVPVSELILKENYYIDFSGKQKKSP